MLFNSASNTPQYEAILLPNDPDTDLPTAKISIPGLVRHELYLSPEHSRLEFKMFESIFLDMHRARVDPDPEPALSTLNFHTIAVLVIESYVTACTTLGTIPTDIDPDDIFFATIDKWRVGRESHRENYAAIRGIQEFADVALDCIFWVKEHGLEAIANGETGAEEGKKGKKRKHDGSGKGTPQRKVRCDKGVPRGPRTATTLAARAKGKEQDKGSKVVKK